MPLRPMIPLLVAALTACTQQASPATDTQPPVSTASAVTASPASGPVLRLRVDGREWRADRELFGAVHPPGLDRAVLMAGSLGPKDANEQSFNLHLSGVDGPGIYTVRGDQSPRNVVQLANTSEQRFMIGGTMGYDIQVEVLRLQSDPVLIEARFHGHMTANDGAVLRIEAGEFRYGE